jgi:hypothetical protein
MYQAPPHWYATGTSQHHRGLAARRLRAAAFDLSGLASLVDNRWEFVGIKTWSSSLISTSQPTHNNNHSLPKPSVDLIASTLYSLPTHHSIKQSNHLLIQQSINLSLNQST